MRHHSIVCRLGAEDLEPVTLSRMDSHVTEISFLDHRSRLKFGLSQAIDQLRDMGMSPSERAVDLVLLAALLTAADTRVSRESESQDRWTREIDLHLPVAETAVWLPNAVLISTMLDFLTGDKWKVFFRPRPAGLSVLAEPSEKLRIFDLTSVCLFSGGLDSFIGAVDLLMEGEKPLLVSHYWDGLTCKYQTHCAGVLKKHFGAHLQNVRARVGFPSRLVEDSPGENPLRGRSFLFFALAALAASAVGGDVTIHVPENGLISLNVPLDPLRIGALSTRTTHPYYLARFNDLLVAIGISARLENRYRHQTKGQMVQGCAERDLLAREAKNTMSCSSPNKYRFSRDENRRKPQHCGHCVPCLIRRASLIRGIGQDDTPYAVSDLDSRVLDTQKAEGEHIRSFLYALARLAKKPSRARLEIHRPGPLVDHPNDLAEYEKVYVEGMQEVGKFLEGVQARPL